MPLPEGSASGAARAPGHGERRRGDRRRGDRRAPVPRRRFGPRRFRAWGAFVALGCAASGDAAAQVPGTAEHAEARARLEAGDFPGAVESAARALRASREFSPPEWGGDAPEGNLVLDDFTGAATAAYRARRIAYRATLAEALAGAGDPRGAATEYRRAAALDPRPEFFRRLADLPGTTPAERLRLLFRAFAVSPAAERGAILDELRNSGAFRTENGLAAALDRFRFETPDAFRGRRPRGLELRESRFPALTLAVEGGAYSTERSFAEGRALLLYFPGPGCPRCGEVIADLQRALRDRRVDLILPVRDADLPIVGRIAELTGAGLFVPEPHTAAGRSALRPRPVGHVARRGALAFDPGPDAEETIWFAARAGLSVLRAPLGEETSVRRLVTAILRFLDDSPVAAPGEAEGGGAERPNPLPEAPEALIGALRGWEAGPEPVADAEAALRRALRSTLRQTRDPAERAEDLLRRLSGLSGAGAAKLRLLTEFVPGFGARMLEAARELDPEIVRVVPDGPIAVAPGVETEGGPTAAARFGILRSYERADGAVVLFAAVARPGAPAAASADAGEVRGLAAVRGREGGVAARPDGFAFHWIQDENKDENEDGNGDADEIRCAAWGPPEPPLDRRCPAEIGPDGSVSVRSSQLVPVPDAAPREGGPSGNAPALLRRVDGGPEPPETVLLRRGLEAYSAGEFEAAEEAFRGALEAIGPGSPVDEAAIRYDLALTLAARGERETALSLLLALGDASFAPAVESAVRRLYRAAPSGG